MSFFAIINGKENEDSRGKASWGEGVTNGTSELLVWCGSGRVDINDTGSNGFAYGDWFVIFQRLGYCFFVYIFAKLFWEFLGKHWWPQKKNSNKKIQISTCLKLKLILIAFKFFLINF